MKNTAQLICEASTASPESTFGSCTEWDSMPRVVERALWLSGELNAQGLGRGDILALVGTNSASYVVAWMASQLAGVQAALINPTYPDDFLEPMLASLGPRAIAWLGRQPGSIAAKACIQLDLSRAWEGRVEVINKGSPRPASHGQDCGEGEIATLAHTSGTTSVPKFCALSHGYFLKLGRFIADSLCLTRRDTVFAPLPLFHLNPLGYGVVGSLTAQASMRTMAQFDATRFWGDVKRHDATALILHAPPASLLQAKTSREDARGHRLRIGFLCGPSFLRQFDIPLGVSGYGSTEAGGLAHAWHLRPDDEDLPIEGATNLAGRIRADMEWQLHDSGEIWVRERRPHTLFAGYLRDGRVESALDEEGWFHTGDRGRHDAMGNLIFAERISESIRVNGEYVPIAMVETRLQSLSCLEDFAVWRKDSPIRGHDVVLYTTSYAVDEAALYSAIRDLPRYMHPRMIVEIENLPRDRGVGKVQRRLLATLPERRQYALSFA